MKHSDTIKYVLISFAVILNACSDETTKSIETDEQIAKGLWQQITVEKYGDPGDNWDIWPGKNGKYPPDTTLLGTDPHLGPQAFQTFVNSTGIAGISSNSFPLMDKSIIVKENYAISGSDTTLAAITAMLKKQGYNPDHNDWFWVKYTPDGTIQASGKVAGCIGCHTGANSFHSDTDYLWTRH